MKRTGTTFLLLLAFFFFLGGCATTDPAVVKRKAEAQEQLGNSLLRDGRYRDALKELLEASKLEPDSPYIHFSIGTAYQGVREYEKSIMPLKKAVQLKPDYSDAWNNLGFSYAALRKYDMTIDCFKKAENDILYRTRHITYENMGAAYHSKGDYKKAI